MSDVAGPRPGPPTARQSARRHIAAVEAYNAQLSELYADPLAPDRADRLKQCHNAIGRGLQLAKVHATLAIAEAFEEWTAVGREGLDQAVQVPLIRIVPTTDNPA